jgi:hypothetical protein
MFGTDLIFRHEGLNLLEKHFNNYEQKLALLILKSTTAHESEPVSSAPQPQNQFVLMSFTPHAAKDNNEFLRMRKEAVMAEGQDCPGIRVAELRKSTKTCQVSHSPGRDLNLGPPEYE